MFKKPKKTVRSRGPIEEIDDSNDNNENDDDIIEITPSIEKLKKEKKEKKKKKEKDKEREKEQEKKGKKEDKKSSLLSFEDDAGEEVEEFKIKKSSASRRLMKQKGRRRSPSPEVLQENGSKKNLKGFSVVDDDHLDNSSKVKRPAGLSWTLSGREAEALHAAEEDEAEGEGEEEAEGSDEDEDPIKKIIQSGGIPDAAAIHAARKKREEMRAKGGKEEYIPLKKTAKPKEDTKTGKRLVREEDEEEEEDEERISFTGGEKREEYHTKVGKEVEEEEDEEEACWEKQQISKAITGSQITAVTEEARIYDQWQNNVGQLLFAPPPPPPPLQSVGGGGAALARPAKYDLKGIRDRMQQRVENLREVSRRHESDADRAVDDLVESQAEITKLEESIPKLASRHRVFQQLRGYFSDLIDCYDEKVGIITYLESRLNKMHEETRGKMRERRRQDVRDQADMLHAMSGTTFSINMDLVQDAIRDFRVAEREGRQRRRRQARQKEGAIIRHNDGMSSDDEMPGQDQASLGKVKQDVENQARMIMEDVIEEFSVLSNVQDKLVIWREDDPDSYKSAFVSLCLPKIFSPLIRLQLLFWNPFISNQELGDQDWYRTLSTFALNPDEDLTKLLEDPDRNLVSLCVEKVIVPKVSDIARALYDPVSTSQTNRIVGLLARLVSDYPTITIKSKFMRIFLSGMVDLIKDSLDQDVYIPMYSKAQMETGTSSPHYSFFHRQFWSAFKLFRNILAWQGILSDNIVSELALDRLLNRYLLLSLRANHDVIDAIDKARVISDCLPQAWLDPGSKIKEKFSMFTKFMATAGASVNLPRDAVQEAARITGKLGDQESYEKLKQLLH